MLSDADRYIVHEAFPSSVIDISAPKPPPPVLVVSDIGKLSASLISFDGKLFFISHASLTSSSQELSLGQAGLQHPNALQDGKFLVDFYICHPTDRFFNAVNQCYWLENHPTFDVRNPSIKAQLILSDHLLSQRSMPLLKALLSSINGLDSSMSILIYLAHSILL